MAEIKSSLEIALERAAAMAAEADGNADEEAREAGLVAARKALNGQIEPDRLAAEIKSLDPEERGPALEAAVEKVLDALLEGEDNAPLAVDSLAEAFGGQEQAGRLRVAANLGAQAQMAAEREMAEEMAQALEDMGITGSAVMPNPLAHPEFMERIEQATAEAAREMHAAVAAFKEAVTV